MDATIRELCLKLLAERHLSVPERNALPDGRAPFSELMAAVGSHLERHGWFPSRIPSDGVIGHGALLELRGDTVWVHSQYEVGVNRYSPVNAAPASTLAEALRTYITAYGGSQIDGVPIDWTS